MMGGDLLVLAQTDEPLRQAWGIAPNNANLVVVADSIGAGTATGGYSFVNLLGFPAIVTINSAYCQSGHELSQVTADLPADGFYGLYQPGKTNVALFQRGTNDLGNSSRSATDTYAFLAAAITAAKVAGFYCVAMTLLPRSGTSANWSTAKAPIMAQYNALVVANSAGADLVIDVTQDPVIGFVGASDNPALFLDNLHPSNAGQDRVAALVRAGLLPVLLQAPLLPTLRSLTLASATAIKGAAYAGGISYTSRAGSKVTATSSDGTALTTNANGVTWSFGGTFATAGKPTITFTETPFGGDAAKISTADLTVSAGSTAPSVSYTRLTLLSAVTEVANNGGGYDYVPTNDATNYNGAGNGSAAARGIQSLPANTDGWFGFAISSFGGKGPICGLSTSVTPSSFSDCAISIFADSDNGPNWQIVGQGQSNVPVAAGDLCRIRRALTKDANGNITGATAYAEVSKDGGQTATSIGSVSIGTGALTPFYMAGTSGANGRAVQPRGQGLA